MGLLDLSAKFANAVGSGIKSYASAIPTIANTVFTGSSKIVSTVAPKIQAGAALVSPVVKSVFTTAIQNPKTTAAVALFAPSAATYVFNNPSAIKDTGKAYIDFQKAGILVASGKSTLVDEAKKFVVDHPVATAIGVGAATVATLKNIPGIGSAGAVLAGDLLDDDGDKASQTSTPKENIIGGSVLTTQIPTNDVFPIAPQTKTLTTAPRSRKKAKSLNTQPVRVTNKIQIINAPMARSYSRSY